MSKKIALVGYGKAGKDVLGAAFSRAGFHRLTMGDLIKDIFDAQCFEYLGFSAHTDDPAKKEQIRPLLVHGGSVFYDVVFETFFRQLDEYLAGYNVINTRLFRLAEAEQWVERGGVIWEVKRKGNAPKEPVEAENLEALREAGYISRTLFNKERTLDGWQRTCKSIVREVVLGKDNGEL